MSLITTTNLVDPVAYTSLGQLLRQQCQEDFSVRNAIDNVQKDFCNRVNHFSGILRTFFASPETEEACAYYAAIAHELESHKFVEFQGYSEEVRKALVILAHSVFLRKIEVVLRDNTRHVINIDLLYYYLTSDRTHSTNDNLALIVPLWGEHSRDNNTVVKFRNNVQGTEYLLTDRQGELVRRILDNVAVLDDDNVLVDLVKPLQALPQTSPSK